MNTDIRILLSFKGHRKRKRLKMVLGPEATDYLIDLWISAAEDRPDGILLGWDEIDIALAAGWDGDPGVLVKALLDTNWLDNDDGTFKLHDWQQHQGWVCGANERRDRARINALIKNYGKKKAIEIARDQHGIDISAYGYSMDDTDSISDDADGSADDPADSNDDSCADSSADSCADVPADSSANSSANSRADSMLRQHAPYPSPYPSPSRKRIAPSGAPLVPVPKKTKSRHFSRQLSEFYQNIKSTCEQLTQMEPKKGRFNPFQWVQDKANKRGHPGAINQSLSQLVSLWADIENPWAYADAIYKTVNGNWNERDAVKIHEELKRMPAVDLQGLTHGLLHSL